jgi:hypothetical protein
MDETQKKARGHRFTPPKAILRKIPALYETEGTAAESKILHLHYFSAGTDLYVAELSEREEDGHWIAFGYSILAPRPGGQEWGYTDLTELEAVSGRSSQGLPVLVERDKWFTPQSFRDVVDIQGPDLQHAAAARPPDMPEELAAPEPQAREETPREAEDSCLRCGEGIYQLPNGTWTTAVVNTATPTDCFGTGELEKYGHRPALQAEPERQAEPGQNSAGHHWDADDVSPGAEDGPDHPTAELAEAKAAGLRTGMATPADQTADILDRLGTPWQRREYALMEATRLHRGAWTIAQASGDVPAATRQAWQDYEAAKAAAERSYQGETEAADAAEQPATACPECRETSVNQETTDAVPWTAHGLETPQWSHEDGSSLCPVTGERGYEPAQPVMAAELEPEEAEDADLNQPQDRNADHTKDACRPPDYVIVTWASVQLRDRVQRNGAALAETRLAIARKTPEPHADSLLADREAEP